MLITTYFTVCLYYFIFFFLGGVSPTPTACVHPSASLFLTSSGFEDCNVQKINDKVLLGLRWCGFGVWGGAGGQQKVDFGVKIWWGRP